jgi:ABC-type sugar transport system substrate-binding protein
MSPTNRFDQPSATEIEQSLSRRHMLQLFGAAGLGVAGVSALAACSTPTKTAAAVKSLGTPITTEPTTPFTPGGKAGTKPKLPARAAYALDINEGEPATWNEWMQKSCPQFGLDFTSTNANQNAATQLSQVGNIMSRGVAGMLIDPVDKSLAPTMLSAMKSGVAVFALNYQTCTCQIGANQYNQAKTSMEAVVRYVNAKLGGKADVVNINWNANEAIKPRDAAIHDVIKQAGPDIRLIADIPAGTNERQIGYNIMNTILHRYPTARVVIGDDTVMLGANAAMVAAGLGHSPEWVLAGCDGGTPEGNALIKSQTSVYRVTAGFLLNAIGYYPAKYTKDWLNGLAIPQVLIFNPVLLNSPETVAKLEADENDVINVMADPAKASQYVSALGSISYDTRLAYYNGYAH